jgi:hypothetical protein
MTRFAVMLAMGLALLSSPPGFAQVKSEPLQPPLPPPPGPRLDRLVRAPGMIEGTLTRVDGRNESVDVSIFLGLLGKTLEVGPSTLIQVNGREARFADLQEGAKVKAFYEERGAKLVATRLEVSTG